jgi:AcrR family transcriptional regulator
MRPSPKRPDTTSLDQTAWLKAAALAISEEGFSGARILPLSKRLGVTRGSFYWHFEDHAAFVRAFVQRWRDQQIHAVQTFQHKSTDGIKAYEYLLDVILKDSGAARKRLKVEFALRDHARTDPFAASAVADVDRARTIFFMPIVSEIVTSTEEAESFARLLLVQVSGTQLAIAGPNCSSEIVAGLKSAMVKSLEAMHTLWLTRQPRQRRPMSTLGAKPDAPTSRR